jgi:hypothetical protein
MESVHFVLANDEDVRGVAPASVSGIPELHSKPLDGPVQRPCHSVAQRNRCSAAECSDSCDGPGEATEQSLVCFGQLIQALEMLCFEFLTGLEDMLFQLTSCCSPCGIVFPRGGGGQLLPVIEIFRECLDQFFESFVFVRGFENASSSLDQYLSPIVEHVNGFHFRVFECHEIREAFF